MPILSQETYKIDFAILENNDPKTIVILDRSNYLDVPQKPIIELVFPGDIYSKSMSYNPNSIIDIDGVSLGITSLYENDNLNDLPDGVYIIKMAVCPYNQLFKKMCYLKTSQLECKYQELLLGLGGQCCIDEHKLNEHLIDIDILIQSAKAEARICNIAKSTLKYNVASAKIEKLLKRVNCK